ncbi:hypothetical protein A9Q84_16805 [Halobacteriovorax marinus]|uniref:Fatty acid cis/trans isomerase n=1 Tax=Halobacteriovorax marinus TaxID=97084 RepID=A0A1Y5FB03_9BACT|nr:hypothetical protein A9Q84_16805 [Halobacteriovorax marinus]
MKNNSTIAVSLITFSIFIFSFFVVYEYNSTSVTRTTASVSEDHYLSTIQPIFNKRCVACHSCYNSPCQLKLSSYDGLIRGANETEVYDVSRMSATEPTRLFVDENTIEGWREKDFFSVIHNRKDEVSTDSVLHKVLKTYKDDIYSTDTSIVYEAEDGNRCSSIKLRHNRNRKIKVSRIDHHLKRRPWAKMPYGLPKLEREDYVNLSDWIKDGAIGPYGQTTLKDKKEALLSDNFINEIEKFETLFNGRSNKEKLSSRYLYEHLFLAHIYFKSEPTSFFRLVRSKTAIGKVDEIATVRPYGDPGVASFYYRFVKIEETIVHKTHITYEFSDKKIELFNELFYKAKWKNEIVVLPDYNKVTSPNPFLTFSQIPAKSRYKFLLNEAQFFFMSFIRGPVCKGQVAVNVIDDHFWNFFIDPDHDPTINNEDFLNEYAKYMSPPASEGSKWRTFSKFNTSHKIYREARNKLYANSAPLGINSIWKGNKENTNAFLTIYRHHNSASVVRGRRGGIPKTLWVVDYPIFEDIFYNLVVGYNVYGAIPHHLKSRMYMETSRINAQDLSLSFLPKSEREAIRTSWSLNIKNGKPSYLARFLMMRLPSLYLGHAADYKMKHKYPYLGNEIKSEISYNKVFKTNSKVQFLNKVFNSLGPAAGVEDDLNCCGYKFLKTISRIESYLDFEKEIRSVTSKVGKFANQLPDVSFLRIENEGESRAYTIVHNKAHYNVNYLFEEEASFWPEKDTLEFHRNFIGSYPNFFFKVKLESSQEFLKDLRDLTGAEDDYLAFVKKYGVSRRNKDFWKEFDFYVDEAKRVSPIEAGIFDLNRYKSY